MGIAVERAATPSGVSASGRRASLAAALTCLGMAAIASSVGFVANVEYMALSAVILASFFLYMRLRTRTGPTDAFEFIIPSTALYFLYFGVWSIYLLARPQDIRDPALLPFIGPALAVAVAGYLAYLVGYGTSFSRTQPSALQGLVPTNPLVVMIPMALGAAGMAVHDVQVVRLNYGQAVDPILSVLQQFDFMYYTAWFLAWYVWFRGAMRRPHALLILPIAIGSTAVVLFYTMGSKLTALLVLTLPVLAYYYAHGRLPKKATIASALILVFVIVPVFNTYRLHGRELGTVQRLDLTVRDASQWSSDRYLNNSFFAFMSRMSQVTAVAAVISDTGRTVDYRYGETLFLAPLGVFVPRVLWPEKPSISLGREFGATFHLKDAPDVETEVSPSVVGDYYWNFGLAGVVVGMYALGAGVVWIFKKYGAGAGFDPIRRATYVGLFPSMILFENNVAFYAARLVKGILIMTVFWALCRRLRWIRPVSAVLPPSQAND